MKKLAIAIALGLGLSLGGCAGLNTPQGQAQAQQAVQYGLVATQVANALVTGQKDVDTAWADIQANKAKFTPAQWAQLESTHTQVQDALSTIKSIEQSKNQSAAGAGATLLVSATQLMSVYGEVKASYLTSKQIIVPVYSQLTPLQQYDLSKLDQSAQAIDSGVQQLNQAAPGTNITPLIVSAIQVAALTLKVAAAAGA